MLSRFLGVMAGLVRPSTPCLLKLGKKDVDARDKRGHDDGGSDSMTSERALARGVFLQ